MPTITPTPNIKIVNDFSEITASDVPMTSPFSLFVKNDLSEVQMRKWNANGLIDNLSFKPFLSEGVDNVPQTEEKSKFVAYNDVIQAFNDRFDALEKLLSENTTKVPARSKKVSDE
ncbi:MAG: hypothetical protein MJ197_10565 [Bacteroidales bacterium]|nr:hypothetical protein [Bacteroidales bacterium]